MFHKVLPPYLGEIINAIAEGEGLDPDFLTVAALSAAASAIGVSESLNIFGTWVTHPALYTVLVGRPGTGKTPPLNLMYKPLLNEDADRYKDWRSKHKQWKALDKEKRNEKDEPIYRQTVLSDCTPESALTEHGKNTRGITIFNDEILGLFKSINRYSSGNFMEQLLSAWSGTQIKITRKGEDEPVVIDNPCISIVGTLQPGRAGDLLTNEVIENGMVDRLLFCYPENPVVHMWRDVNTSCQERINASVEAQKRWAEIIRTLHHKPYPTYTPRTLVKEASDRLYEVRDTDAKLAREAGDENTNSRFAKTPVHIARLALILQCIGEAAGAYPKGNVVNFESLRTAHYLNIHFDKSLERLMTGMVLNNGVISNNPLDVLRHLPDEFTFDEFDAYVPGDNVRRKGRRWREKLINANKIVRVDTAKFKKLK